MMRIRISILILLLFCPMPAMADGISGLGAGYFLLLGLGVVGLFNVICLLVIGFSKNKEKIPLRLVRLLLNVFIVITVIFPVTLEIFEDGLDSVFMPLVAIIFFYVCLLLDVVFFVRRRLKQLS